MRRFALAPFRPLDFLDCGHDPLPDGAAAHVAALQHGVGALGSFQRAPSAALPLVAAPDSVAV